MGRKSKIDSHPQAEEIIRLLASGEEYYDIVRDFPGLTWDDLDYYAKNKLPSLIAQSPVLRAEVEQTHEQEAGQGNAALEEIHNLQVRAMNILERAEEEGDLRSALLGVREARSCVELCLKAEGQLREQSINVNLQQQVSIYDSQQWSKVGDLLYKILAPYPEVRTVVAKSLLGLAREERSR